jgi:hypothetical protein
MERPNLGVKWRVRDIREVSFIYRRQRCPVQGYDPSMAFFLLGTL